MTLSRRKATMGRGIVRVANDQGEWYLEWSTVVDAPVTFGMTRDELEDHMTVAAENSYFRESVDDPIIREAINREVEQRLERLDAKGTSFVDSTGKELLSFNRAGKNETHFNEDQIIEWYCVKKQDPGVEGKSWNEFEE